MTVKRICWDCPNTPVHEWNIVSEASSREGHLITIRCPQCKKESRVFGWMTGCDCNSCKSQIIGAAK